MEVSKRTDQNWWRTHAAALDKQTLNPAAVEKVAQDVAVHGLEAITAAEIWRTMESALTPVIGSGSVRALYQRSVYLTCSQFPWLAVIYGRTLPTADFVALQGLLQQQNPSQADIACELLLENLRSLLTELVGASMTERLLQSGMEQSPNASAVQEPAT